MTQPSLAAFDSGPTCTASSPNISVGEGVRPGSASNEGLLRPQNRHARRPAHRADLPSVSRSHNVTNNGFVTALVTQVTPPGECAVVLRLSPIANETADPSLRLHMFNACAHRRLPTSPQPGHPTSFARARAGDTLEAKADLIDWGGGGGIGGAFGEHAPADDPTAQRPTMPSRSPASPPRDVRPVLWPSPPTRQPARRHLLKHVALKRPAGPHHPPVVAPTDVA